MEISFTGAIKRTRYSGIKADFLLNDMEEDVLYSMRECNYLRCKSKPFGWKYGVNKSGKVKGKECIRQYAYDFYGNKELIKVT